MSTFLSCISWEDTREELTDYENFYHPAACPFLICTAFRGIQQEGRTLLLARLLDSSIVQESWTYFWSLFCSKKNINPCYMAFHVARMSLWGFSIVQCTAYVSRMSWPWRGSCDSLHFGHTSFASKKCFQPFIGLFEEGHCRRSLNRPSPWFRVKTGCSTLFKALTFY